MNKLLKALKVASEYFAAASGAVIFVVTIVASITAVPVFISLLAAGIVGAAFAYYGGRAAYQDQMRKEEVKILENEKKEQENKRMIDIDCKLSEIKDELKTDLCVTLPRDDQKNILRHAENKTSIVVTIDNDENRQIDNIVLSLTPKANQGKEIRSQQIKALLSPRQEFKLFDSGNRHKMKQSAANSDVFLAVQGMPKLTRCMSY